MERQGAKKKSGEVPTEVWEKLAEVIASRRESLGLTKSEAARRSEVSGTTWRLIERGAHTGPADATLVRMARTLHLDPAAVLTMIGRKAKGVVDLNVPGDQFLTVVDSRVAQEVDEDDRFFRAVEGHSRLNSAQQEVLIRMYRLLIGQ